MFERRETDSSLRTHIRDSKQCHTEALIYCEAAHRSDSDVLGCAVSTTQTNRGLLGGISHVLISIGFVVTLEMVVCCVFHDPYLLHWIDTASNP